MKKIFKKLVPEKLVFFRESLNDYPYRRYMDHHKCIFIHIPKAAGTSVLNILSKKKINRDHCNYNVFLQASKKKFQKYFKFCFVRNPYTRLMSVYFYLKNGGNGKADIPLQKMIHDKYPTFDRFVMDYLDKDVIHQITLLRPQYVFVCDYKYEIMVDFCGKFENLNKDFAVICESLGIKEKLPKLNKTIYKSGKDKLDHLSKEVVHKINYLYKKDFEVFGYDLR